METRNGPQTVAVVIPLSFREELTPDEEISLRHLRHFLGKYDKYVVVPHQFKSQYPGFETRRFTNKYFGSATAYGRMVLSHQFYETFSDYKYILIYHLDALVFSDELLQWCETDLDYIGAPWLNCSDSPWVRTPRVGNGGFCLRKVESFLKVLDSNRYTVHPGDYWAKYCATNPRHVQLLNLPRKYLKRFKYFNGAKRVANRWMSDEKGSKGEEHFWIQHAAHYYPEFHAASFEQGLRFAFEVAPRQCFELNGRKLPFGCHAWAKYDREFWEPYLLK